MLCGVVLCKDNDKGVMVWCGVGVSGCYGDDRLVVCFGWIGWLGLGN